MNKLLPFALALALALPGCAAGDTAPQSPETPTTTTETAAEAPAESTLPGLRAACAKRVMIPPPWGRRSTA